MLRFLARSPYSRALTSLAPCRSISASSILQEKPLPPRIKFNESHLTVSYLKGSGPGGQKINKTNSAVQLTHKPSGTVVKCQATRSRSQNKKIAEQLLADKVEQQERGDKSRAAIKADRARKKKASKVKKSKRKYRALEGEKQGEVDNDEVEEGVEEGPEEDSRGVSEENGQEKQVKNEDSPVGR
ncbi:peptidyl-tRNA hydrolase domain protein [Aspergillus sclerotialis]|uniref:Peptidyl-tRNA hydrolase domain protein n=1 Tax=Aspergillus sclerotialis TaxID=2070753 RepID=A0A3A2ZIQ6_9EURO|nr:peptidyl-tRNA hydrolase domain protein [Aspergillus sclerotialis]